MILPGLQFIICRGGGLINEAVRRCLRCLLVGLGLLACFASIAYAGIVGATASQRLSGRVPGTHTPGLRQIPVSVAGDRYRIVIEPSLEAGQPGWTSALIYSGLGGTGGGGGYPTRSWPFVGTAFTTYAGGQAPAGDVVDYFITGPGVAAVHFGTRVVSTFSGPQLPSGDRAAVFFVPASSPVVIPYPGIRFPGKSRRLFALDSRGRIIRTHFFRPSVYRSTFWQAPSAGYSSEPPFTGPDHPLPGACELSEHGLPALTPEFGHVIKRIRPVHSATGEVFLSCIDTTYYLHGWPLEVAVLVNAKDPGHRPGPIPGAHRVPGHPATMKLAAGSFPGALTGRRIGQAWLVVQGGASLGQRLGVLDALTIQRLALPQSQRSGR